MYPLGYERTSQADPLPPYCCIAEKMGPGRDFMWRYSLEVRSILFSCWMPITNVRRHENGSKDGTVPVSGLSA